MRNEGGQVTQSFASLNACQARAVHESVKIEEEVLRTWDFLENLFIHSEEVKKDRLPQLLEGLGNAPTFRQTSGVAGRVRAFPGNRRRCEAAAPSRF